MKTRERIIQASLVLFNEHGERAITTNHIAAHLGISPGNLYYHFRNKQDIIQCIFQLYENNLEHSSQPYEPQEVNVELLLRYLDGMFNMLWQFRFLYANLSDILSQDESLKHRYLTAQKMALSRTVRILQQLSIDGVFNIQDDEVEPLADTIKLITSSWVSYKLAQSKTTTVSKADLYEGIMRVIILLKPYATESSLTTMKQLKSRYQEYIESA